MNYNPEFENFVDSSDYNPNNGDVLNNIPVITSTDVNGKTRLLYIGLIDHNGMQRSIQIDRTIKVVKQYSTMIVHTVEFTVNDTKYTARIAYDIVDMAWHLLEN